MNTSIKNLVNIFDTSKIITFLTGAGMSTESGIPDFRSQSGIYSNRENLNLFDISNFYRNPESFYNRIKTLVAPSLVAKPNEGHLAIADLENKLHKQIHICTQNIDGLHQKAGSKNVYELHGSIERFHCLKCGKEVKLAEISEPLKYGQTPFHTGCGGILKPDIVFFGEPLPEQAVFKAQAATAKSDAFIVVGTSLAVYPAAALPSLRSPKAKLVIINHNAAGLDDEADVVIRGSISQVMKQAVALLVN
jgi:NAD-dependent deacetylase